MKPKVLVAFPVGGSCRPEFAKSLLALQRMELLNPSPHYELLEPEYCGGLYVVENRNALVTHALSEGIDWLLQIDADESFPAHLVRQLMKTADAKNRPIVTGLYANVQPAETPGATIILDMIYREIGTGEYESIIPPSDMRPFMVDACGSGCLLVHASVYKKLQYPWFWLEHITPTDKDRPQLMNEDIAFCRKAREAGYQLWCDPQAELTHHKSMPLIPSPFRRFMERSRQTERELSRL